MCAKKEGRKQLASLVKFILDSFNVDSRPLVLFLVPVRDDLHPKRNNGRQKLAALPILRFENLSTDVYYELARRYPEFEEDVC